MPVTSCVEDLRVLAQKPVPRMFCDYVDDCSWTKSTCRANSNYFQKITLGQRQAITMARHSTATDMFGPPMRMAVALVPTGMAGMQNARGVGDHTHIASVNAERLRNP